MIKKEFNEKKLFTEILFSGDTASQLLSFANNGLKASKVDFNSSYGDRFINYCMNNYPETPPTDILQKIKSKPIYVMEMHVLNEFEQLRALLSIEGVLVGLKVEDFFQIVNNAKTSHFTEFVGPILCDVNPTCYILDTVQPIPIKPYTSRCYFRVYNYNRKDRYFPLLPNIHITIYMDSNSQHLINSLHKTPLNNSDVVVI